MSLLFLAFCGYLINLIYQDRPLIQNSSESISSFIETPDIEICLQNSTMRIVHCSAMYYNWTTVPINNCWQRFFYPGSSDQSTKCYIFETNGAYRMTNGITYDNRDALRRLDFYWKIDSPANVTYASISVPAMAVQLYDPKFSSWRPATVGNSPMETLMLTNIKLGASKATTMRDVTSSIFYTPNKYRAIKPGDAAAVLGLTPNYIDIATISNFQQNWPLLTSSPNAAINRSLYDGMFTVQLAQSTIDVQTEVRQHTVLASLGLAGGCYGVLTSIYILFFGMTRLTPWGLVHHIPVFISNKRHKTEDKKVSRLTEGNETTTNNRLLPWFLRNSLKGKSAGRVNGIDKGQSTFENFRHSSDIPLNTVDESLLNDPLCNDKPNLSPVDPVSLELPQISMLLNEMRAVVDTLKKEQDKNEALNSRVEELENVLADYFIDTSYVDQIRQRRKTPSTDADSLDDRRENLPK